MSEERNDEPYRCQFKRAEDRCTRTDTEVVEMYDGGYVTICPRHRSWLPAMARPSLVGPEGEET